MLHHGQILKVFPHSLVLPASMFSILFVQTCCLIALLNRAPVLKLSVIPESSKCMDES